MVNSLNVIVHRREKLAKAIAKLEKRLTHYRREHDEISTALNVMERYGMAVGESPNALPETIGDMALQTLRDYPDGLTAIDILEKIQNRWMPNLMRSSLSPPLSRLRRKGEVDLDGDIWKIPTSAADDDFEQLEDLI